jgi:hypothetical protein
MPDDAARIGVQEPAPVRTFAGWIKTRAAAFASEWVQPVTFDWQPVLAILLGAVALAPLTSLLPVLGWDWYFFVQGGWNATYPPWLSVAIAPLAVWDWRVGLALLNGLLLMTVAIATARETKGSSRRPFGAILLTLLTPPVFMLLWLGNVASLTLLGLVALPVGVPYTVLQPHLASWAILARRQWMLWGIGFFVLTLVVWGWWPGQVLGQLGSSLAHPLAMGWQILGWPVAVAGGVLLLLSNADPFRLIAAGAFLTPYLMPQHFVLLIPAIGRAEGKWRWLLWASAWLTLLPAMFLTTWSKYVAMLFPLAVWWVLRPAKHSP